MTQQTNENSTAEGQSARPALLEQFEKWWQEHGQYCRAGGGEYEKTFAFRAWEAATKIERDACESMCVSTGAIRGDCDAHFDMSDWCRDSIRERSNDKDKRREP